MLFTVKRAMTRVWLPRLHAVIGSLKALAASHRDVSMLARTHGQPATPITMGKEIGVFAWRLRCVAEQIEASEYVAKFSGATGLCVRRALGAHIAARLVPAQIRARWRRPAWPGAEDKEI